MATYRYLATCGSYRHSCSYVYVAANQPTCQYMIFVYSHDVYVCIWAMKHAFITKEIYGYSYTACIWLISEALDVLYLIFPIKFKCQTSSQFVQWRNLTRTALNSLALKLAYVKTDQISKLFTELQHCSSQMSYNIDGQTFSNYWIWCSSVWQLQQHYSRMTSLGLG